MQERRHRRRYTCRVTAAHGRILAGAEEKSKKQRAEKKGNHCGLTPTSSGFHCLTDGTEHHVYQKQGEQGRRRVSSSAGTGKEGGKLFSPSACLAGFLTCSSIFKSVIKSLYNWQ